MGFESEVEENLRNLKIKNCRVMSVWLLHGSIAALGSVFTIPTTGNSITHWWVEIETEDPDVWFNAQFDKPILRLSKHSSREEVHARGEQAGFRQGHDPIYTVKRSWSPPSDKTIGDVQDWMTTLDPKYNVVSNNCQDLGENFAAQFSNPNELVVKWGELGLLKKPIYDISIVIESKCFEWNDHLKRYKEVAEEKKVKLVDYHNQTKESWVVATQHTRKSFDNLLKALW